MQQILHGDYRSSWGIRANMIRVSKDLVIENPLLGVGIGDAKSKFTEKVFCYDQQQYINYSNLHNGFLQILVETGFLGLIAFMLFLYYLAKNAKINQKIFLFSIAVIVNILVGFLGEPLLFRSSPYLLFNLMTAMIIYTLLEKAKSPSTPCCFQ
jgi:O-antigen ligase